MADRKTKPTEVNPAAFIKEVDGDQKQKDCLELVAMMKKAAGKPAKMWGPAIIGLRRSASSLQTRRTYFTPEFATHCLKDRENNSERFLLRECKKRLLKNVMWTWTTREARKY